MTKRSYASEFPRFPALEPEVVALLREYGFDEDSSWHNDICPSFFRRDGLRWKLWTDHPDPDQREMPGDARFILTETDEDGLPDHSREVITAESVQDLSSMLKSWRESTDHQSVAAARLALEAHQKRLGVEGDAETQVWHLLASLREYCATAGIDLSEQLADVDNEIRVNDYCPAAKRAQSGLVAGGPRE